MFPLMTKSTDLHRMWSVLEIAAALELVLRAAAKVAPGVYVCDIFVEDDFVLYLTEFFVVVGQFSSEHVQKFIPADLDHRRKPPALHIISDLLASKKFSIWRCSS